MFTDYLHNRIQFWFGMILWSNPFSHSYSDNIQGNTQSMTDQIGQNHHYKSELNPIPNDLYKYSVNIKKISIIGFDNSKLLIFHCDYHYFLLKPSKLW